MNLIVYQSVRRASSLTAGGPRGLVVALRIQSRIHSLSAVAGEQGRYLPDGSTADFSFERLQHGISDTFNGDAVRAAIDE